MNVIVQIKRREGFGAIKTKEDTKEELETGRLSAPSSRQA